MSEHIAELEKLEAHSRAMGGPQKVAKHHASGRLTARERIDGLVDPGSFVELGLLAHSDIDEAAERTPADGKVCGVGRIDGRLAAVCAYDATVLAGAGGRVGTRKVQHLLRLAVENGYPIVMLHEGGGARIPDILGSDGILSSPGMIEHALRMRRVPMVTAVLGDGFGQTSWDAAFSDFTVQRKGTCLAVSGPNAIQVATGENTPPEELGGWEMHAKTTGLADLACDDEPGCLATIRAFLSYLPSHCEELPPRIAGDDDAMNRQEALEQIVPIEPRRGYSMHKVCDVLFDKGSLFEIKPLLDRSVITALARLNGAPVGVVASNPMYNAGALGAGACSKITDLIVLCDSFHLPLILLSDTPGFFVGKKAEEAGVSGRITNQWTAFAQATVPKISVVLRKGYGGGYYSLGAHGMGADLNIAWVTADVGFVAPEVAVNIVHSKRIAASNEPQALRERLTEELRYASAPWRAAGKYFLHDVIRPRDTRDRLLAGLAIGRRRTGFSERRLANWPTSS